MRLQLLLSMLCLCVCVPSFQQEQQQPHLPAPIDSLNAHSQRPCCQRVKKSRQHGFDGWQHWMEGGGREVGVRRGCPSSPPSLCPIHKVLWRPARKESESLMTFVSIRLHPVLNRAFLCRDFVKLKIQQSCLYNVGMANNLNPIFFQTSYITNW